MVGGGQGSPIGSLPPKLEILHETLHPCRHVHCQPGTIGMYNVSVQALRPETDLGFCGRGVELSSYFMHTALTRGLSFQHMQG